MQQVNTSLDKTDVKTVWKISKDHEVGETYSFGL